MFPVLNADRGEPRARGTVEGITKAKNFADVINGWSLTWIVLLTLQYWEIRMRRLRGAESIPRCRRGWRRRRASPGTPPCPSCRRCTPAREQRHVGVKGESNNVISRHFLQHLRGTLSSKDKFGELQIFENFVENSRMFSLVQMIQTQL